MSERSRRASSDIDGQTERSNGAFGKSDIEGKAARVAARELGTRTSFKWAVGNERVSTFRSACHAVVQRFCDEGGGGARRGDREASMRYETILCVRILDATQIRRLSAFAFAADVTI